MRELYKIGDFVKYTGDYSTMDAIRRNEDIAKIILLKKTEAYWFVGLQLNKNETKISCLVDLIRPIATDDIHLRKLGFKEHQLQPKGKYFERDGILISGIAISIPKNNYLFSSGFCLGDLTNLSKDEIQLHIKDGAIDVKSFYSKYPGLNNINDIFEILKNKGLEVDEKSVIS
ncbi:MAG TPA: hypothetical protein PLL09_01100 [Flavobacterium sp.]|uniref:hypothetical protein n=1 Tax=unclassified Flavobacterium TaxID=196869 RepID=UPI0025C004B5|nr:MULTISPECIES: hypothetical protein [unclassified Flavobacterium]HRE76397.1 hypothetical protein [Flavobacterium sp.]